MKSVRDRYVTANLRNVPSSLKAALMEDAQERGVSISEHAATVLAEHFRVKVEGSGRAGTNGNPNSGQINLRIPPALASRLYQESRTQGVTVSSVALRILADRYSLTFEPRRRSGGRPAGFRRGL